MTHGVVWGLAPDTVAWLDYRDPAIADIIDGFTGVDWYIETVTGLFGEVNVGAPLTMCWQPQPGQACQRPWPAMVETAHRCALLDAADHMVQYVTQRASDEWRLTAIPPRGTTTCCLCH